MRRAQGYGLPELLVALAIGLLVSLFATTVLQAAQAGFAGQVAAADVDDAGRYALDALARALRQAGFADWSVAASLDDDAEPALQGLDNATLSGRSDGLAPAQQAAVNGSDVLALHFGAAAGAAVLNCAGFGVTDEAHGWSIFYVGRAGDGETELRCKYRGAHGWAAEAIVRGVDGFQVRYGIDTDRPPDGAPNRYANAAGIAALDAELQLQGATPEQRRRDWRRKTWWKRVCVVRVALLLHGATGAARAPRRFALFGERAAAQDDPGTVLDEAALPAGLRRRERRVFDTTIALRNPDRAP